MSLDDGSKLFQYSVQSGDNLGDLVERYRVSSEAIQAANPGVNFHNLQAGAIILIPMDPPLTIGQTGPSRKPESGPERRRPREKPQPQQPGLKPGPGRRPEGFPPGRRPEFYRPPRPYRPYYRPYRPYYPYLACPVGARPYTIQPGDTLYRISDRFGISPEEIADANPYIDFREPLPSGQFICLPVD